MSEGATGVYVEDRYLALNDGNAYDALVLARLVAAFGEHTVQRADGCWLPCAYATLAELCHMPEATVRKSISRMAARRLVRTLTFGHNGVRTLHLQLLHPHIIEAVNRPDRAFDYATQTPPQDISDETNVPSDHLLDEQTPQEDISPSALNGHLNGAQTSYQDVSHSHMNLPQGKDGGATVPGEHLQTSPEDISPAESLESLTIVPITREIDSQDSAPDPLTAAQIFFKKLDTRGISSIEEFLKTYGADRFLALIHYAETLTGKSRPKHPRWFLGTMENMIVEGVDTPQKIRALIPVPEQRTGKPDDPDGRNYINGKYADFIEH